MNYLWQSDGGHIFFVHKEQIKSYILAFYRETLFYQGFPVFAFWRSRRANMKIVKMFSFIKAAIWTGLFDIIPTVCGFKCLRRLIIQRLMWADLIVKLNIFIPLHTFESAVLKCIPVDMLFPFWMWQRRTPPLHCHMGSRSLKKIAWRGNFVEVSKMYQRCIGRLCRCERSALWDCRALHKLFEKWSWQAVCWRNGRCDTPRPCGKTGRW